MQPAKLTTISLLIALLTAMDGYWALILVTHAFIVGAFVVCAGKRVDHRDQY
ncbi:MAG: hypothetical protein IIA36_11590 [Proteobacteria bacterium]|nr:hypothetical protein [Pseudomonadota bacterium]